MVSLKPVSMIYFISLIALTFVYRSASQNQSCAVFCPYYSSCFWANPVCIRLYLRCQCDRRPQIDQSLSTSVASSTTNVTASYLSASSECGISPVIGPAYLTSSRIIGGQRSQECEFPWMATVRSSGGFCGGTIIDSTHVLTAAHCVVRRRPRNTVVTPRRLRVGVGSANQSRTRSIPVLAVTVHPQYIRGRYIHDIAILTLARPLTWTNCLNPLCLPDPGQDVTPGQVCVTAGWGLTRENARRVENDLRSVKVPVVDREYCSRAFRRLTRITESHVCAGLIRTGGQDACSGDSGGPMMCNFDNRWKAMGVVSFGRGCGRRGTPGVYTYVPYYLSWIHSVIA